MVLKWHSVYKHVETKHYEDQADQFNKYIGTTASKTFLDQLNPCCIINQPSIVNHNGKTCGNDK